MIIKKRLILFKIKKKIIFGIKNDHFEIEIAELKNPKNDDQN